MSAACLVLGAFESVFYPIFAFQKCGEVVGVWGWGGLYGVPSPLPAPLKDNGEEKWCLNRQVEGALVDRTSEGRSGSGMEVSKPAGI